MTSKTSSHCTDGKSKKPKVEIKGSADCDTTKGKWKITFVIDQKNARPDWFFRFDKVVLKVNDKVVDASKLDPKLKETSQSEFPYSVKKDNPLTTTLTLDGDVTGEVSLFVKVVWAKKVKVPAAPMAQYETFKPDGVRDLIWVVASSDEAFEKVDLGDKKCKKETTTTTITTTKTTLPVTGEGNVGGLVGAGAGMVGLGIAAFATIFVLRRRRDRMAEEG